jgi:hypothetical protein
MLISCPECGDARTWPDRWCEVKGTRFDKDWVCVPLFPLPAMWKHHNDVGVDLRAPDSGNVGKG